MLDTYGDQASGLRRLFLQAPAHIVTVVADASVRDEATVQLARAFSAQTRRVAVVDENNSIAALWGLRARSELAHWLSGTMPPQQAVLAAEERIVVLPAARGLTQMRERTAMPGRRMGELLKQAGYQADVVVCAAAPADARRVHVGFAGEGELALVVGARADEIKAAYVQLKLLARCADICGARVLIARAKSEQAARSTFEAIAATARRFLAVRLDYCGILPGADPARDAAASHLLQRIGERLIDCQVAECTPVAAPQARYAVC